MPRILKNYLQSNDAASLYINSNKTKQVETVINIFRTMHVYEK